ncbi:MAG: TonB-dependent receptor [Saprospiraceae bacterium]|nr:TonB-dependent receptor [Candidatus Vicinibacter affinis]
MAKLQIFNISGKEIFRIFSILVLILPFIPSFSPLRAQDKVEGVVKDKRTNHPLQGVIVRTGSAGTVTDDKGYFQITMDPNGLKQLNFSYLSYKQLELKPDQLEQIQGLLEILMEEENVLLQTAVISSSRFERPISESPVSMELIKPEYPERLTSTSVQQVLDRVPGVQILDGQANIRGGSGYSYGAGSRVMLIMDDLPILQPDAGFPNWDDLPLENVGQIEIVKGAASALYGSAAMNGIIHFRNIKPSLEPFTRISIIPRVYLTPKSGNQWWGKSNNIQPGEFISTFVHRKRFQSTDLVLGGYYGNKTGFNQGNNSQNFRINGNIAHHFSEKLAATLGVNINTGNSSSFFYWNGEGSFSGDTTSYSNSEKLRFSLDPSVQYFTSKNFKHKLMTRWLHVNNNVDNNQSNKSENFYSEYQIQKTFKSLGLSFNAGIVGSTSYINAKLYSDTIFNSFNLASYVQFEQKLFDRLNLSAGIRYEYFSLTGPNSISGKSIKNPSVDQRPVFRLGANYRLMAATYLRASWGQGFRFPTIAEKYITTNAGGIMVTPNPDLKSEYGDSYEIGVKQGLIIGRFKGMVDFSGFLSRYQNMMEFSLLFKDFRFLFQSQNVGDTRIKGFEIGAQGVFDFGLHKIQVAGGYTYIDPKFKEWDITGKDVAINTLDKATQAQRNAASSTSSLNVLKYRSKHLFRWDVEYQFKKFFAGLNFNYASHVAAVDWLFEVDVFIPGVKEFRKKHNYGYRIYDFRLGYQFEKYELQINLNNAFNEAYTFRPGLMEAPRNISARMAWRING